MSYPRAICTRCGYETVISTQVGSCPKCEGRLLIDYDVEELKEKVQGEVKSALQPGMWKYHSLLPLENIENRVSLGEGGTYFHKAEGLASTLDLDSLYLKDETMNPTGSFLDRGTAVEITALRHAGVNSVYCWSTGNLAASVVAYAARAALRCAVYIPRRGNVDVGKLYQILAYAADVQTVSGDRGVMARAKNENGASHNIRSSNPYFLEGIKTTTFEIIEQMEWKTPDWLVLPMGSGGHLSMAQRGLQQLRQVGLIEDIDSKLLGVQAKGCSPIVDAFQRNTGISPVPSVSTIAIDIGIKDPSCGQLALEALRDSGGMALAVSDEEILNAVRTLAKTEGIFAEPASATTIAALKKSVESGEIDASDTVVCIITSTGLKYPDIAKSFVRNREDLKNIIRRVEGPRFTMNLGETKILIMQILYSGESYGYGIWKTLKEEYDTKISIPSVYQHLNELRHNGLIVKTREEKTIRKTSRVYYALTEKGREVLTHIDEISD
ncbi:threonine synthase [Candidatus Thorarchaeota archaeon]|nr:MAG: threonine synthase [Candidatus Thorarchaeota archaeon]